ncbi:MAG: hypothetical protein Kow0058_04420 [Roseovarius sp.]
MDRLAEILANYHSRRHLLQTMHLPVSGHAGRPFLYMKNHKAACTNVLALLVIHLHRAMALPGQAAISMEGLHKLQETYLRAGARALDWATACAALTAPGWFRFTLVRDPVSRTVSAWADKLRPGAHPRHRRDLMRYLGRDPEEEIGLSTFLDILARDEGARDLDRHWRPQHKEISYGLVAYDLIGRIEDMEAARRRITTALFGAEALALPVPDTRRLLGHRTASQRYRDNLTAADRRNIERAFARDFEMYEAVGRAAAA